MEKTTEKDFERLLEQVTSAKEALTRYSATGNFRDFKEVNRKLDAAIAEANSK